MMVCNLSVILAQSGLKISHVSKTTGLSRTTLTELSKNRAQGIELKTLDILCRYLNVLPNDILVFLPNETTDAELKERRIFSGGYKK